MERNFASSGICRQLLSYSTLQQELACQGSNGAVAASANKDIGFGHLATQEEIYVGSCAEACPTVLVTRLGAPTRS
ncbi:acriflavine sensitivity control protein acr-2, partial [Metarhizium majus ARSEF 297]